MPHFTPVEGGQSGGAQSDGILHCRSSCARIMSGVPLQQTSVLGQHAEARPQHCVGQHVKEPISPQQKPSPPSSWHLALGSLPSQGSTPFVQLPSSHIPSAVQRPALSQSNGSPSTSALQARPCMKFGMHIPSALHLQGGLPTQSASSSSATTHERHGLPSLRSVRLSVSHDPSAWHA